MNRLISLLLVCLMCFYIGCPQAMAVTASSYESIINQLVYAATGQLPNAQALANMGNALSAANAPTSLAGLQAAYSTNAAVTSIIDSIGTSLPAATYGSSTESFIAGIYQNAFGRQPQIAGLMFWSNAVNSGTVTKGNTVLNILAGAAVADMTTLTNTIATQTSFSNTTSGQTSIIDKAAQEAADKAAQEAADKAAQEAADKAAKEAADKAAKEAADKAAKEAADKAAKEAADKAAKEAADKAAKEAPKSSDDTSVASKVKSFVHKHPVATTIIVTVVIAGIVTAITVPICVHQHNLNKVHNQQRALNNQAYVIRLRQLSTPSSTTATTSSGSSGSSGGYQPPI